MRVFNYIIDNLIFCLFNTKHGIIYFNYEGLRNLFIYSLVSEWYDLTDVLLSCGADLNADFSHFTDLADVLLWCGADLNADLSHFTDQQTYWQQISKKLLFISCNHKDTNMLQKVIDCGINLQIVDSK